jgi:dTDP-4-dehydrorhamnose reductase
VLPARGWEVLVIGRPELDLLHPDRVAEVLVARGQGAAAVVNPAAHTAVDRAEDEPEQAFAINRDGARAVAEGAALLGLPLIHLSTDYVYDGGKGTPYRETDAPRPLGVYGASKLAGEQAVAAANPRHVILRTQWVASPYGANFVKTMLRLAGERPELRVVADQLGTPTFAADLALGIARVLENLCAAPELPDLCGTFHVAGAGETTWHGFAEAIMAGAAARGHRSVPVRAITTAEFPTRARRPADARLDCSKIAATHGFALPPWREGLEACLDRLIGACGN